MFFVVHVEYSVISEVCHHQTIIFISHVDYGVSSEVFFLPNDFIRISRELSHCFRGNSSPDDVLRSPRGVRRHLRGLSWPDNVIRSPRLDNVCQCQRKIWIPYASVLSKIRSEKKKQILPPKTHWHKFPNFQIFRAFDNKHENVGEHAAVHVDDENYRLVMKDLREKDVPGKKFSCLVVSGQIWLIRSYIIISEQTCTYLNRSYHIRTDMTYWIKMVISEYIWAYLNRSDQIRVNLPVSQQIWPCWIRSDRIRGNMIIYSSE